MKTAFEKMRQNRVKSTAAAYQRDIAREIEVLERNVGRPLTFEERTRFRREGFITIPHTTFNPGTTTLEEPESFWSRFWA